MSGYVDLHCHYLPGIDDGVRTFDESLELLRALKAVGFATVVATPHIRSGMFDNRPADLRATFESFVKQVPVDDETLPGLGLAAEHHVDDVFWELFLETIFALTPVVMGPLWEFPERSFPVGVEERFFQMRVKRIRPVLAHPERYSPVAKDPASLERLVNLGVLPLLDLMSLQGKYGQKPQRTAENLLERELYYAACSDTHRPGDVDTALQSIERLRELVGEEGVKRLLVESPTRILEGRILS